MIISEVLNDATDLIEREGWYPGDDSAGTDPACAGNAILRVSMEDAAAQLGAWRALWEHIGGTDLPDIWEWNDEPGRTKERVVATMRATALIAAAREQDAAFESYAPNLAAVSVVSA